MSRIKPVMVVSILSAGLAVSAISNDAQASLRFCNQTDSPVSLSVAWMTLPVPDGYVGRARGWWALSPGECRTVVNDLDASKATVLFHAHSRDLTWGRKLRYDTRRDGRTRNLTPLNPFGGTELSGVCIRTAMFDREVILASWGAMDDCERGFYPAAFVRLPHSKDKDVTHNLTGKKLTPP